MRSGDHQFLFQLSSVRALSPVANTPNEGIDTVRIDTVDIYRYIYRYIDNIYIYIYLFMYIHVFLCIRHPSS